MDILLNITIILTLMHLNALAFLVYKQWQQEKDNNHAYLLNNHSPAELLYQEGTN